MLKYSLEPEVTRLDEIALSRIFNAFADPNRLRIFSLLLQGTHCNCELAKKLEMPPNLISHHLAILRRVGLVEAQRALADARWIYYSVNRKMLERLGISLQLLLNPNGTSSRQPRGERCLRNGTSAQYPHCRGDLYD